MMTGMWAPSPARKAYVVERISVDDDEIREGARRDDANLAVHPAEPGADDGGGTDDLGSRSTRARISNSMQ